ncbi:hypothetical protein HYV50_04640 [Candidatus Pacearchaeota archaeon]|nr:hypothetical protein [Candidatus Pacearchaeota archaeon]
MVNKKRILSCQIPQELVEKLEESAQRNFMNESTIVRKALSEYFIGSLKNDKS